MVILAHAQTVCARLSFFPRPNKREKRELGMRLANHTNVYVDLPRCVDLCTSVTVHARKDSLLSNCLYTVNII